MKSLIAVLCAIAIIANTYSGYSALTAPDVEDIVDDDDIIEAGGNATVKIPEQMIFDISEYDYDLKYEMYQEDKIDGKYWHTIAQLDGTVIERIPDAIRAKDGYGKSHPALRIDSDTQARLTLFVDSDESEPITVTGATDVQRYDYYEFNTGRTLQAITHMNLTTDGALPFAVNPIPITVSGKLRTFPDPADPIVETMEDKIFGDGKTVTIGDNGTITEERTMYNWSAEAMEKVSGYDCLRINITMAYFDTEDGANKWEEMPFFRQIWISNEVPKPVRYFTRSFMEFEDENGTFYNVIEIDRTIKANKYQKGTKEIPWNLGSGSDPFVDRHVEGEYETWNYMASPGDDFGSYQSSFDYNPFDAIDFALQESTGNGSFAEYMQMYDTPSNPVIVTDAEYNATKQFPNTEDKSGTYGWSFYFGHRDIGQNPRESTRNKTHRYSIEVEQEWECTSLTICGHDSTEYDITTYIKDDRGLRNGSADVYKSDLPSEILTIDGIESILQSDAEVHENVYNSFTNKINWGRDGGSSLYMGAGDLFELPGLGIVETLTGFAMPPSPDYSWIIQIGSVWGEGETYTTVLDATDGRFAYSTYFTSNVPLEMLFI